VLRDLRGSQRTGNTVALLPVERVMFGLVVVPANTRRASSGANRSRDPAWQPLGIPSDG